jgi:hypothetical protein
MTSLRHEWRLLSRSGWAMAALLLLALDLAQAGHDGQAR